LVNFHHFISYKEHSELGHDLVLEDFYSMRDLHTYGFHTFKQYFQFKHIFASFQCHHDYKTQETLEMICKCVEMAHSEIYSPKITKTGFLIF
jgi:hypothetical protein